MPYLNGVRVTQEVWLAENGKSLTKLATSQNGENPATGPEFEEGTSVPKPKSKKAGNARSKVSAESVDAAVADALGDTPEAKS